MELIGQNQDGSGFYNIYRDGDQVKTLWNIRPQDATEEDYMVEGLVPVTEDVELNIGDFNDYGVNGHKSFFHWEGGYCILDGVVYDRPVFAHA